MKISVSLVLLHLALASASNHRPVDKGTRPYLVKPISRARRSRPISPASFKAAIIESGDPHVCDEGYYCVEVRTFTACCPDNLSLSECEKELRVEMASVTSTDPAVEAAEPPQPEPEWEPEAPAWEPQEPTWQPEESSPDTWKPEPEPEWVPEPAWEPPAAAVEEALPVATTTCDDEVPEETSKPTLAEGPVYEEPEERSSPTPTEDPVYEEPKESSSPTPTEDPVYEEPEESYQEAIPSPVVTEEEPEEQEAGAVLPTALPDDGDEGAVLPTALPDGDDAGAVLPTTLPDQGDGGAVLPISVVPAREEEPTPAPTPTPASTGTFVSRTRPMTTNPAEATDDASPVEPVQTAGVARGAVPDAVSAIAVVLFSVGLWVMM